MRTSPWLGLAIGLVVLGLAGWGLRRGTPLRLSYAVFLALGLLSIGLSLLELIH